MGNWGRRYISRFGKDFVCIFTCLLMESMDGGVLISPDCARLIVDLSDALEGGAGALAGKYS